MENGVKKTIIPPVIWLDGIIYDDAVCGWVVMGSDGVKYAIPHKEQTDLQEGERVQFVPRQDIWRGKRWIKRLLFVP